MSRRAGLLAGTLLLASGWLRGQVPPEERVPIRDLAQAPRRGTSPQTYGTSQESLLRVGPMQFAPLKSSTTYDLIGSPSFTRYPTGGVDGGFAASPSLPSGALVTFVQFDVCDINVADDITLIVFSMNNLGQNLQILQAANTSGTTGCASHYVNLTDSQFVVDNASNQLLLVFQAHVFDGSESLAGATVYYKLQVSPSPATATFDDVPTNHPFFQFIEALGASGITGGCGGGNYCPDAPLTRGQMAVFLAKALGLQWP